MTDRVFTRAEFFDYMSRQLIDILSMHEKTGTLMDGKNLFLLHTDGVQYKIVIERSPCPHTRLDSPSDPKCVKCGVYPNE